MRRWLFVISVLCAPAAAFGQTPNQREIFGGYSYVRMNEGAFGTFSAARGYAVSFAGPITDRLSLMGGFSFHRAPLPEARTSGDSLPCCYKNDYMMTGGAKWQLRAGRTRPFLIVSGGLLHDSVLLGLSGDNGNAWLIGAGAGMDHDIGRHFAVRIVQAEYVFTTPNNANSMRVSTGLVARF